MVVLKAICYWQDGCAQAYGHYSHLVIDSIYGPSEIQDIQEMSCIGLISDVTDIRTPVCYNGLEEYHEPYIAYQRAVNSSVLSYQMGITSSGPSMDNSPEDVESNPPEQVQSDPKLVDYCNKLQALAKDISTKLETCSKTPPVTDIPKQVQLDPHLVDHCEKLQALSKDISAKREAGS